MLYRPLNANVARVKRGRPCKVKDPSLVIVPKVLKKRGRKPKMKVDSVASIVGSLPST
jgi:hypothetical protein